MQPIEAVEHRFPLRVEHFGLREDSAGDGQWRGGLGCRRAVRVLADNAQFSVVSDHNIIPPYGVRGVSATEPNRFTVIQDGVETFPPSLPGKISGFPLREGDIVLMQTSAGGGFGDPLDRDPQEVLQDIREGYVTPEKAKHAYGVTLLRGAVDSTATEELRQQIKACRTLVAIEPWEDEEYSDGARLCYLSPGAAERLNAHDGDLVEIENPQGAPLRGWVRIIQKDGPTNPICYLGPTGRKILRLEDGANAEVRRLDFEPLDVARSVLPYSSRYDGLP